MKTVALSDVAESIDYGVTASADSRPVGPKFLRITDIQDGAVNWSSVPFCEANARKLASCQLKSGDIVFARTGATTGKSFLIRSCPEHAVFASYLIRVRPSPRVNASYLAHFFDSPEYWNQISLKAVGAAQPGVNSSRLKELQIPLPPFDEQRRIAAILDRADELRRMQQRLLRLIDTLDASIFNDMFGDPVTNPMAWNTDSVLGDVAEIVSGVTKGRQLNGHKTRVVPYLAVVNVQDRALNLNVLKTIDATEDEITRFRLRKNDLLLTEGGDPDKLGRGTLWNDEIPECIHQNHIFRVRLSSGNIHPVFLNWLVGSKRGKQYFLRSAKQTTGIASINMTQLRQFPLLIPPSEIQLEFAGRIAAVERLRTTAHKASTMLDALFASLQHRAFRGELTAETCARPITKLRKAG